MKDVTNKLWNYLGKMNGVLLITYLVAVFFVVGAVNGNFSYYYLLWSVFVILVVSILVCPKIMQFLSNLNIHQTELKVKRAVYLKLIKMALYAIPLVFFLLYYFAYYPGSFSADSLEQYGQAIANRYNDWHPVIQTLFTFKLPLMLTGGWIGSIVLFQICCLSATLGYTFNVILKYTNIRCAGVSMLFVLMNPQTGYMAMYPWKDVSFAMGALLLLTYALQIYMSKGQWIASWRNTTLLIVATVLTTLFRHNGILFTAPLLFAILFFVSKKRAIFVCVGVLVLLVGVKVPLYAVLDVEKPEKRQIETLGFPMNIIGAAVTYAPDTLDEETKEFAYKIAPREVWEEKYRYGNYNYVKWDERTNNDVIEEYGAKKVISMMLGCFQNSKKVSITALVKMTEASYTVTDYYAPFITAGIGENDYGIVQGGNDKLKEVLTDYGSFMVNHFRQVFLTLGIAHFLLILSVLCKCKLNKLEGWKKIFFVIPIFCYNYGTTLLLTGTDDVARFMYYTFLLMPTMLVLIYLKNGKGGMDEIVQ